MARLSDGAGLGIDTLFCRLNDRTAPMERAFAAAYGFGDGYGMLPILQGAAKFKQAVMGTLTAPLLGLVAAQSSALQTFDGITLSATLSALNANLKETLQDVGRL